MNSPNFAFLSGTSEQLVRLGRLAENYYSDVPNTCLSKLRQFAELLAQQTASQMGLLNVPGETQYDLLRRLQDQAPGGPWEEYRLYPSHRHWRSVRSLQTARGLGLAANVGLSQLEHCAAAMAATHCCGNQSQPCSRPGSAGRSRLDFPP